VVNLILSIDTLIVVSARVAGFSSIIIVFGLSAIIRLFSLDQLAQFIQKYATINLVISIFMILIGLELFLEGFWFKFLEEVFNLVMVLAIIVAIIHQRGQSRLNLE